MAASFHNLYLMLIIKLFCRKSLMGFHVKQQQSFIYLYPFTVDTFLACINCFADVFGGWGRKVFRLALMQCIIMTTIISESDFLMHLLIASSFLSFSLMRILLGLFSHFCSWAFFPYPLFVCPIFCICQNTVKLAQLYSCDYFPVIWACLSMTVPLVLLYGLKN